MVVLFDLDGTLLDTSYDICHALNLLLESEGQPTVSHAELRPMISLGGRKLISYAFKLQDPDKINMLFKQLLKIYQETNFDNTRPFDGIDQLLNHLDQQKIRWGIVTNKTTALTEPILKKIGYSKRAACVVCADTTSKAKPHPEPMLYACKLLNVLPKDCIYIGDSETDIQAGRAAGMATMAVSFGYTPQGVSVSDWQPDYIAHDVAEILPEIKKWSARRA